MILTAVVFLVILSLLVLIHEYGHFWVAKKLNIKVEEFAFGFPPRLFSRKKGETEYSVNALPIGGYVKLYGEDEAGGGRVKVQSAKFKVQSSDLRRAFFARPAWQRALVSVAGVVMNALLAIAIYYSYLAIAGFKAELPLFGDHKFFLVNQQEKADVIVSAVAKNSPAENIGITPFSKITSINGVQITNTREFIQIINTNKGKEIAFTWQNIQTNKTFTAKAVPRVSPPKGEGALGVAFVLLNSVTISYDTPVQRIFSGPIHTANLITYNIDVLSQLVKTALKEKSVAPLGQGVSGPVGIYNLVGSIVQIPDPKERLLQVLNLAGLLSISLALFNILPIPALDGGRLFFIIIEWITGRRVNQKIEGYVHTIGMILLLTLIAFITIQDFRKLIFGF
ncbi:MAG: site-2 protease family protein [Candidatus Levybacteria bacterium]|nr:site-2 protease family protein [Candidatus Levybacteria bacterium]